MSRYSKDRGSRSISIGAAIPAGRPQENSNTTPANAGTGTGAGDEFVYIPHSGNGYQYPNAVAWDVVVGGTGSMAVLVVNLEVSDDGTNWSTLDSNASITGGRRVVANTLGGRMFRANIGTFTVNAGAPVCTVGISL